MPFFKKTIESKKVEGQRHKSVKGGSGVLSAASVIKHAWVTEKAGGLQKLRKYVFVVSRGATKPQIKNAVEGKYKVNVVRISVINARGKVKRRGQHYGKAEESRKAMVTLKSGQSMDIMPT